MTDFGRIDEEELARCNPINKVAIAVSFTGARLDLTPTPLDKEIHRIVLWEIDLVLEVSIRSFKGAQQTDPFERHYLSSAKWAI